MFIGGCCLLVVVCARSCSLGRALLRVGTREAIDEAAKEIEQASQMSPELAPFAAQILEQIRGGQP